MGADSSRAASFYSRRQHRDHRKASALQTNCFGSDRAHPIILRRVRAGRAYEVSQVDANNTQGSIVAVLHLTGKSVPEQVTSYPGIGPWRRNKNPQSGDSRSDPGCWFPLSMASSPRAPVGLGRNVTASFLLYKMLTVPSFMLGSVTPTIPGHLPP